MDFLSSLTKTDESKPNNPDHHPNNPDHHSNSDIFSNAKLVAEAAQAQFGNQPEKYDKAKVAAAAAELLDDVSQYGKFDDTKGIGKYVDQAEDYLRKYGTSQTTTTTTTTVADSGEEETTTVAGKPGKGGESGGSAADHVKFAEDKPSSGGEGGGAGGFMKLAGDFLKK